MEQEKEITIYDIAKTLNISPATVSRGLKDHPAISKKTKKKINETATAMGYRSNTFASNLRTKSTNTIGVIVPRLNSNFMSSAIAGMEKVANAAGYNLIISQSLETVKKEILSANTMFHSRVDGLMVSLAYDTEDISHFEVLIKKGIPLIFFDRVPQHNSCTNIVIDNYKVAYDATKHLIDQGCKRIVHIAGNLKRNVYADRLHGYEQALADNGITKDADLVLISNLNIEAGPEATQYILNLDPQPDGIFAANDAVAVGCMQALKQAGKKIPEDIAIIGFNNDPLCKVIEPNLTTIDYPGREMGELAATTLINQLTGKGDINVSRLVLRSELIIRESSQKIKS
jgi:LacI family transcriptional regulator